MATKSKILIIGATGYMGKYLVEESVKSGHPTFALTRETALSDPSKSQVLDKFKTLGVTFLFGDLNNHESLVNAIKQVDVVISVVGGYLIADQIKIISAIKEAGNIKRFLPSEFGMDVDRAHAIEPVKSFFESKSAVRRAIESEGIPYTYISNHGLADYFLSNLGDYASSSPPRDKINITGNGNIQGIYVAEGDVAEYTIRSVDDPRTLNKSLFIKPPACTFTYNELVSLWEKKIGKTLEKVYLDEEQIIQKIEEVGVPMSYLLAMNYSVFVKGCNVNFEIHESFGVEATQLYPDIKYTTIEESLNKYV